MRSKRSKRYRKLMHQYEVTFGFREPYQVLVDSHFLQATHSFKMDIVRALERTLQGKVKPFITKCSLAAAMSSSASSTSQSKPDSRVRPPFLPPPTVVPLRYCSHNDDDSPIDEASCLLSLLSPNPDAKKNKEHYILATADPTPSGEENSGQGSQQKKKSNAPPQQQRQLRYNLKRDARMIPGVPIIYVKRSVMVLEPMSGSSESVREGAERGKFKTGVSEVTGKRKRDNEGTASSSAGMVKKAKGPNPLSVKKPKKREKSQLEGPVPSVDDAPDSRKKIGVPQADSGEGTVKAKRKRRHKSQKADGGATGPDTSLPAAMAS